MKFKVGDRVTHKYQKPEGTIGIVTQVKNERNIMTIFPESTMAGNNAPILSHAENLTLESPSVDINALDIYIILTHMRAGRMIPAFEALVRLHERLAS